MQSTTGFFRHVTVRVPLGLITVLLFLGAPLLLHAAETLVATPTSNVAQGAANNEKIQLNKLGERQYEATGLRGTLIGSHTVEYLIEAKTGQSLELDLVSNHAQAGLRITAPAAPRALFKGQGPHARYSVTLPRDGTYRVLVYLLEAAASNGDEAEFVLNIRLSNPG